MSDSSSLSSLPDLSRDVPDSLSPPPPIPIVRVQVDDLKINAGYQRGLGSKNYKAIRNIIRNFSWVRFGVLSCAKSEQGLEVIDGQHRAIAAKALGIKEVPVVVVEKEDDASAAKHFVGMNTDRTAVSAGAKFLARLTAQDKTALAVNEICVECGVEVLAIAPRDGYSPGQTLAAAVVEQIYKRSGGDILRRIFNILTDAKKTPLRADDMRTLNGLMMEEIYRDSYRDADLITALTTFTPSHISTLANEHVEATGDTLRSAKSLILWRIATSYYEESES